MLLGTVGFQSEKQWFINNRRCDAGFSYSSNDLDRTTLPLLVFYDGKCQDAVLSWVCKNIDVVRGDCSFTCGASVSGLIAFTAITFTRTFTKLCWRCEFLLWSLFHGAVYEKMYEIKKKTKKNYFPLLQIETHKLNIQI